MVEAFYEQAEAERQLLNESVETFEALADTMEKLLALKPRIDKMSLGKSCLSDEEQKQAGERLAKAIGRAASAAVVMELLK